MAETSAGGGEVMTAWAVAQARQAEQHAYALALSTYMHDLAAAEDLFSQTLKALAETLARALPSASKAAGVQLDGQDAGGTTTRGAFRALANHGRAASAAFAQHAKIVRAEGLKLHRLDVEHNRLGRGAQARREALDADVRAAQAVVDGALAAHAEMCALAERGASEPPPGDPWLAEVALHAARDRLQTLGAAQDRGMRCALSEAVAADVALTDTVGSLLADAASAQRRLHEGLMDRCAELVGAAKGIDGGVDLQRCVRLHLPEGSAAAALLRAPGEGAEAQVPAPQEPPERPEQPPLRRNLARVEKLGLLSRQQPGLLAGLDIFGGWSDSLGVLTRGGWLHLFSSADDSRPHDSLCLVARPRGGEPAASARPVPGQPGVFEVAKQVDGGGFLFRAPQVVRWVLRAESAAAASEWLALVCAHTQLSRPPGSLAGRASSVSETAEHAARGQPQQRQPPHTPQVHRGAEALPEAGEPEEAPRPPATPAHPVGVVELDDEEGEEG